MFTIKNLTVKNFMSVGNATQAIKFDRNDLTLVLGQNLDLGGDDSGARNGTGKTTIINALSYALYGEALTKIRKENLINKTNGKAMMVTIDFENDGVSYKIERGRKPNITKFFVGGEEQEATDESQGDSRETQAEIERMLGMSHDMFKHIVALNTYTEPFLSLKAADQRTMIEQLLGITQLSDKAEALKEQSKLTKDGITQEEYRIKALGEANSRIQEQVDSLIRRQVLWQKKYDSDLEYLVAQYDALASLDVDAELLAHKDLALYTQQKEQLDRYNALLARQVAWQQRYANELQTLQDSYVKLNSIDIEAELTAHVALAEYNKQKSEQTLIKTTLDRLNESLKKEQKLVEKLALEIATLEDHKCYACGQDFHDDKHNAVLLDKRTTLEAGVAQLTDYESKIAANNSLVVDLSPMPVTHYRTEAEAVRHSSELTTILDKIEAKAAEIDPYAEQLLESNNVALGAAPVTHYAKESQAVEHKTKLGTLLTQISNKHSETDPYSEQIAEMQAQAVEEINFDEMNRLVQLKEHQDFLLKLLTNKDSFVRKRVMDQNLSYLNQRLSHYLDKIGLPHTVVFQNDLSVNITELGRELDFDNLSRGERNRLILSLSWSFRDVWESLYTPINLLFIDEVVDSGMDSNGVESALSILKGMSRERNKSIWLVSHKDELSSRVNNILTVTKENGFTNYSSDVETT